MPLRVGRLPTNHAQRVKEVTSTAANDCCWRCWMPHRDPERSLSFSISGQS